MAQKYVTSEVIKIKNARLSFAKLEKPLPVAEGGEPRYDGTALLDPSDKEHQAIIKTIKAAAEKIAKETFKGVVPSNIRLCFGPGDDKFAVKPDTYAAYKGLWYISAHEKVRPGIANRKGEAVMPGEPQFPYSGCYVNMNITLWCFPGGKGSGPQVNANLRAVQFVKDGPAFGRATVNVEEEFDAIEEDEDAPSPFD